jgi:hypothetical protein
VIQNFSFALGKKKLHVFFFLFSIKDEGGKIGEYRRIIDDRYFPEG